MSGLSLNCTIHYNKWDKYLVLFADNTAAVALRTAFNDEVVYFVHTMATDIAAVAERANRDLTDMTAEKVLAKKTAADAMGVITSNAFSFAQANNLTSLKGQMKNATASKLNNEKDENLVSRCASLNTQLTAILAAYPLTAVNFFTAAQLTAAMGLVGVFDSKLGIWAVARADVNNAKIEFEFEWMPKMATSLNFMEGMLPGDIKLAYPSFVGSFISLKKLVRAGVKDQGIIVSMSDSVSNELFINTGKMETLNYTADHQKSGMTNSSGEFSLMKLKVGLWRIKFSSPGYVNQIVSIKVERRKVTKVDIKLVKL